MLRFLRRDVWSDFVLGQMERRRNRWRGRARIGKAFVPFEIAGGWLRPPVAGVEAVRDCERLLDGAKEDIRKGVERIFRGAPGDHLRPLCIRARMKGPDVRLEVAVSPEQERGQSLRLLLVDGRLEGIDPASRRLLRISKLAG